YHSRRIWSFRDRSVTLGRRPLVMGVVNVTPDSFSAGGRHSTADAAIEHALRLAADGADFLDVGGESSRPGAKPVSLDEELARVVPVIRGVVRQTDVPLSIDTTKAEVARQALQVGAAIVTDMTAAGDPGMAEVVRQFSAGIVLMHMQGTPETMQANPTYQDVVSEVRDYLAGRVAALVASGVRAERLAIDPGIGFGQTSAPNPSLLRELGQLQVMGRPGVLGVARKGFVGEIARRPVTERLAASLAAACYCAAQGTAQVLRVHDVAATVDAAKVIGAIAG